VDGGAGTDSVIVAANMATSGGAVAITSESIKVNKTRSIDTRSSSGNSGAITLRGAKLLASAVGGTAGAITLEVDATEKRTFLSPIDFSDRTVTINVGQGAKIDGGTIKLKATAIDISST